MRDLMSYDLSSMEFFADPFPTFRRMREERPVYFHEPLGVWFVTRYRDIEAVLRDDRFSNRRARELLNTMMPALRGTPKLEQMIAQWSRLLWFLDPPDHTRSRTPVNRGFGPAALDRLRPMVKEIVQETLDRVRDRGEVDIVDDVSDPIAITTIASMFGVPVEDRPRFRDWAVQIMKAAGAGATDEDNARRVEEASRSLFAYIGELVQERVRSPGEDIISRMLEGHAGNPAMVEEIGLQCVQILGASYITSTNQISNAVLALLEHPEELARLRADTGLLKGAIEEILRFDPSIMTTNRLSTEDVELASETIPKGALVFLAVASANRDPEAFVDPDRFNISREAGKHLAFSLGPHYCPGGPLVRIELEEALPALLNLGRWELAGPYEYGAGSLQDHGPKTLPIRFGPS